MSWVLLAISFIALVMSSMEAMKANGVMGTIAVFLLRSVVPLGFATLAVWVYLS
jgi:hypothetical protein